MEKPIKILIVDDHNIVRKGLIALLDVKPGVEVIGEAPDGEVAVQLARTLNPDVILLDLVMPKKDGIMALQEILAENPNARILILTSFPEDDKVKAALAGGAKGFLLKDSSTEELLTAINSVFLGQHAFHPDISQRLIDGFGQSDKNDKPPKINLTGRELGVLKLIAKGLTNQEIALELSISIRTVTTHVSNIFGKLGVENRTEATYFAIRNGLIDSDEI